MIADSQTNYLYLADSLLKRHPDFYNRFNVILSDCKINFSFLPDTKDIWAVDYMPIQVKENTFIQFAYNPDYLQFGDGLKSISNVDAICKSIDIQVEKSPIKLDGGNVVKMNDTVIMCDKFFKENSSIKEYELTNSLRNLLQIENIVFIPTDPYDEIGHADGMVRFIDEKTVLINAYSTKDIRIKNNLITVLKDAGLDWIEIPYNPYKNKTDLHANGIYMNFLQMDGLIIVPTFNIKEDEVAVRLFEDTFEHFTVKTIESNEIADGGGILNCITWNIKK